MFVGSIRNHPLAVADELGLPDHAVATFGLAIGRPDPTEPAGIKPRLPQAAVLHHETYDAESADSHVEAYDEVLSGYNRRYGLEGDWSTRVLARLAHAESLHLPGATACATRGTRAAVVVIVFADPTDNPHRPAESYRSPPTSSRSTMNLIHIAGQLFSWSDLPNSCTLERTFAAPVLGGR